MAALKQSRYRRLAASRAIAAAITMEGSHTHAAPVSRGVGPVASSGPRGGQCAIADVPHAGNRVLWCRGRSFQCQALPCIPVEPASWRVALRCSARRRRGRRARGSRSLLGSVSLCKFELVTLHMRGRRARCGVRCGVRSCGRLVIFGACRISSRLLRSRLNV